MVDVRSCGVGRHHRSQHRARGPASGKGLECSGVLPPWRGHRGPCPAQSCLCYHHRPAVQTQLVTQGMLCLGRGGARPCPCRRPAFPLLPCSPALRRAPALCNVLLVSLQSCRHAWAAGAADQLPRAGELWLLRLGPCWPCPRARLRPLCSEQAHWERCWVGATDPLCSSAFVLFLHVLPPSLTGASPPTWLSMGIWLSCPPPSHLLT